MFFLWAHLSLTSQSNSDANRRKNKCHVDSESSGRDHAEYAWKYIDRVSLETRTDRKSSADVKKISWKSMHDMEDKLRCSG